MAMGDNGWDDNETIPIGPPGRYPFEPTEEAPKKQSKAQRGRGISYPSVSQDKQWRGQAKALLEKHADNGFFSNRNRQFWGPRVEHELHQAYPNDFIKSVAGWYFLRGFLTAGQFEAVKHSHKGTLGTWDAVTKRAIVCGSCKEMHIESIVMEANCPRCWQRRYKL